MTYLQYTEFRNKAKDVFDAVEKGECSVIIRKGQPIARLEPMKRKLPSWKNPEFKGIQLPPGAPSMSDLIRSERAGEFLLGEEHPVK